MKYNLKKHSVQSLELTDDRDKKALAYEQWRQQLVGLLESGDSKAVSQFVKQNKGTQGFPYFFMSMLPYVQSVYDDSTYSNMLGIARDSDPNLRDKIHE